MKNKYTDYMDTLATSRCALVNDKRFPRRYTLIVREFHTEDISRIETEALMRNWIHETHGELLRIEREIIDEADRREKALGIGKYAETTHSPAEREKLRKGMYEHTISLLEMLQDNRYSSKSKIWEITKSKMSRKKFETSIAWLLKSELIAEIKIGKQTMYPLTTKGHDMLTTPLKDRVAITHYEHDWHCQQIIEQLKARGYIAVREYGYHKNDYFDTTINGKPTKVYEKIDVYAEQDGKHVAYEFINKAFNTLDFTVHKCLHNMEMDLLVIVCKTLPDMTKAREKIESTEFWKHSKEHLQGKIQYRTFNNLF